jgi:hypothetical protein
VSMSSIKRDVKKKTSASTGVEVFSRDPAHCSFQLCGEVRLVVGSHELLC